MGATNNEMELKACIKALQLATGRRPPVELSLPFAQTLYPAVTHPAPYAITYPGAET